MAQKEDKKRKRQANATESPSKRVALDAANSGDKITVSMSNEDGGLYPVLASTPGISAPTIPFVAYAKPLPGKDSATTPKPDTHDVTLHSAQHPRLDYTASKIALDTGLSHYVAAFDPESKSLQITPAHHLSLRSKLRTEEDEEDKQRRSYAQQREELGREFGTKKAKRAIADKAVNAIVGDKKGKGKANGVQDAILESMADATAGAPNKDDLEDAALASKPIPKPNRKAENVEDVYTFNTLIPQSDARLLQVKDWLDKTKADEALNFNHRFPATRVQAIGKREDAQRLKALKYLSLLLQWHDALQTAGRAGKKVPKKEVLQKKLADWPDNLVDSVRRRFATPANELPKWNMDNLFTHICALTLFVDGWTTDTTNLRDDLKMENKEIQQYFRELGCKVGPLTEKERETRGLKKAQAAQVRVAKLRLPLDFPKARSGRRT